MVTAQDPIPTRDRFPHLLPLTLTSVNTLFADFVALVLVGNARGRWAE